MRYFFYRILWFIPTLWLISILVFFLSHAAPGDPIADLYWESELSIEEQQTKIKEEYHRNGLDKPLFYFGFYRWSEPDTAYKIIPKSIRKNLLNLSYECGSWELVDAYYTLLKEANQDTETAHNLYPELIQSSSIKQLQEKAKGLDISADLKDAISALSTKESSYSNYLFYFSWFGFNNQYQDWLNSFLKGEWGNTLQGSQSKLSELKIALKWTFGLSLLSLIISLAIAVPTGAYAAIKSDSRFDRFFSKLFFVFYAIPNFWMATLVLILFASGSYFDWFPLYGTGELQQSAGFWEQFSSYAAHLALPLFCLSYGSLAYLFRQVRSSVRTQLSEDYMLTARSKGLSTSSSLWRHAFRNALLPLITILGNALPALISGAFVIEYIFNIPGMGKLSIEAFLARDYPIIFTLCFWGAFFTILGTFLADLAYHWADPRIELAKPSNTKKYENS